MKSVNAFVPGLDYQTTHDTQGISTNILYRVILIIDIIFC